MTDSNDKDRKTDGSRPGGGTLTLKRPSIEQSKVKQSFGAGRSKTVVVETKRKRFGDDKPAGAAEPRPAFQQQPRVSPQAPSQPQRPPQGQRSGVVLRTLSAEEKEARDRALAGARVREAEDRKRQEEDAKRRTEQEQREHVEREAAAKRKAEEDARHKIEDDGKRKAEESHFRGLPKVRVMIHDYEPGNPFQSEDYPEPKFDDLSRVRVLHIFRDRGAHEELIDQPFDFSSTPAPAPVGVLW